MRVAAVGLLFLIFCSCSQLQVTSSTQIGTDAKGFAVGQYSDSRSGVILGKTSGWWTGGGGGGHHGFGLGLMSFGWSQEPPPTEGNPLPFARAIATINYSRTLTQIKCDPEITQGVKEYNFSDRPLRQKDYQPFGHQTE